MNSAFKKLALHAWCTILLRSISSNSELAYYLTLHIHTSAQSKIRSLPDSAWNSMHAEIKRLWLVRKSKIWCFSTSMFRLFIHNRFSKLDVDASFPFTRRTSEVTLYLVQSFQQRYFEDTFQIVSLQNFQFNFWRRENVFEIFWEESAFWYCFSWTSQLKRLNVLSKYKYQSCHVSFNGSSSLSLEKLLNFLLND